MISFKTLKDTISRNGTSVGLMHFKRIFKLDYSRITGYREIIEHFTKELHFHCSQLERELDNFSRYTYPIVPLARFSFSHPIVLLSSLLLNLLVPLFLFSVSLCAGGTLPDVETTSFPTYSATLHVARSHVLSSNF